MLAYLGRVFNTVTLIIGFLVLQKSLNLSLLSHNFLDVACCSWWMTTSLVRHTILSLRRVSSSLAILACEILAMQDSDLTL